MREQPEPFLSGDEVHALGDGMTAVNKSHIKVEHNCLYQETTSNYAQVFIFG